MLVVLSVSSAMSSPTKKEDDLSGETLQQLFLKGSTMCRKIESSGDDPRSEAFQDSVRKAVLILEDSTRMVSALDLFSANEDVSEVPTEHLQYMMLPALLGALHGRLQDEGADREDVIKVQEAYFRDFLGRCNDYEVCQIRIPDPDDEEEGEGATASAPSSRPGPPDLSKMNREREDKLRRYKERKELEERLDELREAVEEGRADEDQAREFHLGSLKRQVGLCLDELASFAMEKPILRHMNAVRAGKAAPPKPDRPPRPLKPIVITRDAAQKEVFGLGYRNVPILSIEEFYEQRVRDGWFPAPGKAKGGSSLQDMAADAEAAKAREEEEEREKERKEEEDDQIELARKRRMDEYKDTHKRGEGNRHNMG